MKIVPFVHVRNVATNEHFDIPFDFYNHKKAMCKTDPDFYQWESSEIVFNRNMPDSFMTVSEMSTQMYDPSAYMVDEPVEEAEEPTPVEEVVENPKLARFNELKAIGFVKLKGETAEETAALKAEYKSLKEELGL